MSRLTTGFESLLTAKIACCAELGQVKSPDRCRGIVAAEEMHGFKKLQGLLFVCVEAIADCEASTTFANVGINRWTVLTLS